MRDYQLADAQVEREAMGTAGKLLQKNLNVKHMLLTA